MPAPGGHAPAGATGPGLARQEARGLEQGPVERRQARLAEHHVGPEGELHRGLVVGGGEGLRGQALGLGLAEAGRGQAPPGRLGARQAPVARRRVGIVRQERQVAEPEVGERGGPGSGRPLEQLARRVELAGGQRALPRHLRGLARAAAQAQGHGVEWHQGRPLVLRPPGRDREAEQRDARSASALDHLRPDASGGAAEGDPALTGRGVRAQAGGAPQAEERGRDGGRRQVEDQLPREGMVLQLDARGGGWEVEPFGLAEERERRVARKGERHDRGGRRHDHRALQPPCTRWRRRPDARAGFPKDAGEGGIDPAFARDDSARSSQLTVASRFHRRSFSTSVVRCRPRRSAAAFLFPLVRVSAAAM